MLWYPGAFQVLCVVSPSVASLLESSESFDVLPAAQPQIKMPNLWNFICTFTGTYSFFFLLQ